jgi:hypothetical protein
MNSRSSGKMAVRRRDRDRTRPVMADWLKIDKEMALATYEFGKDLQ